MRWWTKSILVGVFATALNIGIAFLVRMFLPMLGWEIPAILLLALVSLGFLIGALSGTVAPTPPPSVMYPQPEHHTEINVAAFREEIEHLGPGRWNPDMLLAGVIPLAVGLMIFASLILR